MTIQKFRGLGILLAFACTYACSSGDPGSSVVTKTEDTTDPVDPTPPIIFGDEFDGSNCANPIEVRRHEVDVWICQPEETGGGGTGGAGGAAGAGGTGGSPDDNVPPVGHGGTGGSPNVPPTGNGGTGGNPPTGNGGTGGTGSTPDAGVPPTDNGGSGGAPPNTDGGTGGTTTDPPPPPPNCEDDGTCGSPHCSGQDQAEHAKSCSSRKATVCHIPRGNPDELHTICVGKSSVPAHLAHGDYEGACIDEHHH